MEIQELIELTNYILSIQDPKKFDKERVRIGKLIKSGSKQIKID